MNFVRLRLGVLLLSMLVAGCGSAPRSPSPATVVTEGGRQFVIQPSPPILLTAAKPGPVPAMLENTRWEFRQVLGENLVRPSPGQEPYLKLANGRLDGFSGCNLFNGDYQRDIPDHIRFLTVRGSMLKCPGQGGVEKQVIQVLQQVRSWRITPQQDLQFLGQGGQLLAEFSAVYPKP